MEEDSFVEPLRNQNGIEEHFNGEYIENNTFEISRDDSRSQTVEVIPRRTNIDTLEQMNANLRHNFGQRIQSLLNDTALVENDEEMNIEEPEINNEAVITPIIAPVIPPIIAPVITPIIAPISNDVIAPISKAPIPKDCLSTDCHHMIELGMHFNRTDLLKGYGGSSWLSLVLLVIAH